MLEVAEKSGNTTRCTCDTQTQQEKTQTQVQEVQQDRRTRVRRCSRSSLGGGATRRCATPKCSCTEYMWVAGVTDLSPGWELRGYCAPDAFSARWRWAINGCCCWRNTTCLWKSLGKKGRCTGCTIVGMRRKLEIGLGDSNLRTMKWRIKRKALL